MYVCLCVYICVCVCASVSTSACVRIPGTSIYKHLCAYVLRVNVHINVGTCNIYNMDCICPQMGAVNLVIEAFCIFMLLPFVYSLHLHLATENSPADD